MHSHSIPTDQTVWCVVRLEVFAMSRCWGLIAIPAVRNVNGQRFIQHGILTPPHYKFGHTTIFSHTYLLQIPPQHCSHRPALILEEDTIHTHGAVREWSQGILSPIHPTSHRPPFVPPSEMNLMHNPVYGSVGSKSLVPDIRMTTQSLSKLAQNAVVLLLIEGDMFCIGPLWGATSKPNASPNRN